MKKKQEIDFLSITAHELRTPLSIVKGYLAMVLEGDFGKIPAKLKAVLKSTYDANERVMRLVDNLLGIAQLQDKTYLSIDRQKFEIINLFKQIIKELKLKAKLKKITLSLKTNQNKIFIKADELMLHQMMVNLLNNAIKYAPNGKVTISVIMENKKLKVSVADTGPGLDPNEVKGIFEQFIRRQVKNNNKGGFGLGLYVSKLVVEAHRGKIWAQTRGKDFGFKINFEIPV